MIDPAAPRQRLNAPRAAALSSRAELYELEGRTLLAATPWGWAPKMIGLDQAVAKYPALTGAGYAVAVIDSGVDYKHPVLGGAFGGNNKVEAGWDFQDNDADPFSTTVAHGTATAGIIAGNAFDYKGYHYQGVAPGAKIIALRASTPEQTQAALDWVAANRTKYNIAAVELLHLSGQTSTSYKTTMDALAAQGVFIAHPSGNGGSATPAKNSASSLDFSVGSVNSAGQVSSFTQRGANLDLLAPGEKVTVPYYDPATGQHIYTDAADGTSWAAPAATATAVLIKQISAKFTPAQIMQIMQDSGTATADPVSGLTYKRLNVAGALTLAYQRAGIVAATPTPPPVTATPAKPTTPVAPKPPVVVAPKPPAQTSFTGTAIKVAGSAVIQAEAFDKGGEGIAYHDAEAKNLGNSTTRVDGVDVRSTGSLKAVTSTKAGEWFEFTINVTKAGTYTIGSRVASARLGGKFHIEIDGKNVTGTLAVPSTRAVSSFTTVTSKELTLSAGQHVMRVAMNSVGASGQVADFDAFIIAAVSAATPPLPGGNSGAMGGSLGAQAVLGSSSGSVLGGFRSSMTMG